jgi:2-phosphosulfolactate phosphatase
MKIEVYGTQSSVTEKELKDKTVIVVDVLRATSTIITALENGCKEVIPVAEIDEAVSITRTVDNDTFLLGGERNAVRIEGFHLSNSPLEYTKEAVEGRTVVITTTNGTRAIKKAESGERIYIGGFRNVSAVGIKAAEETNGLIIICAGTEGKFSTDDILTAGAIISKILEWRADEIQIDDLGKVCRFLYEYHKNDILGALKDTRHYKVLVQHGFEEDIRFCFQKDATDVIPFYKDGVIRKL